MDLMDFSPHPPLEWFELRRALLYPADLSRHCTMCFYFTKGDPTLRNPEVLDNGLTPNPAECRLCPKPHFTHAALPNVSFSVVVACPHQPDTDSSLGRNKSIARLFPQELEHQTCRGNLVVFKHQKSSDPSVTNRDLPVIDIVAEDVPFVDNLVLRWVTHLYNEGQRALGAAAASPSVPVAQ